ncbi:hypothetical protein HZF24_01605 [Sedimentibacter hydroxybenzoicus DSM 7310]|uniref:Uncharacterized protein n=1 Tax=Sedimentibacter hydroxybenzoicus DSM 7310 TaxID=1123245 RepID=A0A974GUY9_SEDHY|nr:hypothetical protein [Sedimentibacter hydroxybenzoicus]NYB72831.1 hypothetical protein [Sedimentibacter hydroxybenzoicus DSM 7310]
MNESASGEGNFIGYEYRDVTVDRSMVSMYADGYQNFGWILDGTLTPQTGLNNITLKFKRDRKIRNKAELTRLQRQFDACINEIQIMEKSKTASASIIAFTIGLVGTALLAGATFSFLGGLIVLCIILAIPGFIGWILPYFLYNSTYAKKAAQFSPLIDSKHDEIYEICKRANELLS